MHHRILRHVRSQSIGYLALFLTLGGGAYAATQLPRNSVGGAQIRNHSIDPVKLNPIYTGGVVRAWAYVSASGHAYINHGFRDVFAVTNEPGSYGLELKNPRVGGCATTATITYDDRVGSSGNGYAVTFPPEGPPRQRPAAFRLNTFTAAGVASPLPFVVEVLC